MIYYDIIPSPIDPLLLTSDGTALTGLYMTPHQYGPSVGGDWVQDGNVSPLPETARQLQAYFAGQLTQFTLPLQPQGTPFQQRVWAELCHIPFGVTISYGELARRLVESGVNGLLVPQKDAAALAQSIAQLLDDPALRQRLGQAARARVCYIFDVEVNVRPLLRLFQV